VASDAGSPSAAGCLGYNRCTKAYFELSILRRCDELAACFTAGEHGCELLDIDVGGNVQQEAEVASAREHRLPA
jgi:hypothetical protein